MYLSLSFSAPTKIFFLQNWNLKKFTQKRGLMQKLLTGEWRVKIE